jgi:predicted DNA-binding protein YlxM (UPF0122 family)
MNFALITTMLTKDLILTSISSSVKVSTSLVNYFISSTDNNVEKFKRELLIIDLYNSLNVVLTVIEDIIKKHESNSSIKALLQDLPLPTSIDKGTGPSTSGSCLVIANNRNDNNRNDNNKTFGEGVQDSCIIINDNIPISKKSIILPEPVKKALFSTYEIIEKIKIILQQVYKKIDSHKIKYFSSWRSLDLTAEINEIKLNNSIFEKRVAMLFDIIKIYLNKN